jgi:DNA-binding MarR family transcriptional regulator
MNAVKSEPPEAGLSTREHPHLGVLLERGRRRLMDTMLDRFRAAGYSDLREGHAPLFAFLPAAGIRLTELAKRARITKQSMGELVSELEALGYVQREPDPSDGRAKVVSFTAKGHKAARIGVEAIADEERAWAERFGADRLQALRDVLEQVTSSGGADEAADLSGH